MRSKFLYNNEVISLIAILALLRNLKQVEISKAFLILPFLLHDHTVKKLKDKRTTILSLDDLIIRDVEIFTNFNDRFYSFLPLTISALTLGIELGLINTDSNIISSNNEEKTNVFLNSNLGKRAGSIILASESIIKIFKNNDAIKLYFSLRIQL